MKDIVFLIIGILKKGWKVLREEGFRSFIRKSFWFIEDRTGLVSFMLSPYVMFKLRQLDLAKSLELLFDKDSLISKLFRPAQIRWEIEKLLRLLESVRPKYILEIGTARGGTLFLWTRVAPDDALIISVDLPGGLFGGGYPWLKGFTYKLFARKKQRIILIRGDSHSSETLEKVKKIIRDAKLGFLFIDGDHRYGGVKKDFEMYSPLVRKGGIIAFHDIVPHPPETRCEVSRFWNEIKVRYKHLEIVKNWNQKWAGIGVLFID